MSDNWINDLGKYAADPMVPAQSDAAASEPAAAAPGDDLIGSLDHYSKKDAVPRATPTPTPSKNGGFFENIANDLSGAYQGNPQDPEIKNLGIIRPQARLKSGELRWAAPSLATDTAEVIGKFGRAERGQSSEEEIQSGGRGAAALLIGSGFAPKMAKVGIGGIRAAGDLAGQAADSVTKTTERYIDPLPKVMNAAELKTAAKKSYKVAKDSGVVITDDAFKTFVDDIAPKMEDIGYDFGLHPQAERAINRLAVASMDDRPKTLSRLETLRKVASSARIQALNDDQSSKATAVINHIDGFMNDLTPEQTLGGNAPRAVAALNTARPLWRKSKKIEDIKEIMDIAKRQDDPNKYVQSQFGKITRDPEWFGNFTPDEQSIIVDVAKTGKMDAIGHLLSPHADVATGVKLMAAPAIGFSLAGLPGASVGATISAVTPFAGMAAKAVGKSSRRKSVEELQSLISRGAPEPTVLERIKSARAKRRMEGRNYLLNNERDNLLP